jgi:hypothetical protein
MIDLAEVRHALTVRAVLETYQHPTRKSGRDELESTACPRRADHSRRAFTASLRRNLWQCRPCGAGGDALHLVAEFERLNIRDDFPAVLERAAEIAGVGPSEITPEQRRARAAIWRREATQRAESERRERTDLERRAVPRATGYWSELPTRHPAGEAYLRIRGVIDVLERDVVRFDPRHDGSPAIALYTSRGEIRNVVRRRMPELGEPKTPGLPQCPTAGTLVGQLLQLTNGGTAAVTEGMIDTLTAQLAWPDAITLGAHGAGNLAAIVRAVAPMVARQHGRLLIVPHNDAAGSAAGAMAGRAAIDAGLDARSGSLVIVQHRCKDLNDAWRAGWRPTRSS